MKRLSCFVFIVIVAFLLVSNSIFAIGKKIKVVATLPDYASIAKEIGGERVTVNYICKGDQDPHFVLPKPSYAVMLSNADLFLTTGLDLELWAPTIIDKSMNPKIREGQIGYVAVHDGVKLLEVPNSPDRSAGGVHIYGNPHIQTSPINVKIIATNIAIGLKKVDPDHVGYYVARLKEFKNKIDNRLFGKELVSILGGDTLCRLAESGNLISFLSSKSYRGKKLIDYLGGWMKKGMSFRGKNIVTYHKNWAYFTELFGLNVLGEVEPKPAIPPSPKDIEKLVHLMKDHSIKVILAANYYDEDKVRMIASRVGAKAIIVPTSVYGVSEVKSCFDLFDLWVDKLVNAFNK